MGKGKKGRHEKRGGVDGVREEGRVIIGGREGRQRVGRKTNPCFHEQLAPIMEH